MGKKTRKQRMSFYLKCVLIILTSILFLSINSIYLSTISINRSSSPNIHINLKHYAIKCSDYNHIQDITTIDQILNSTLPQIIQYLNKLYCPEIIHNINSYIDNYNHSNFKSHPTQHPQHHIAHVLNAYNAKITDYSYLFFAAPITFISMLKAKQYAMKHGISVGLYSSNFKEDNNIIPIFINKLPNLNRSLQDLISENQKFVFADSNLSYSVSNPKKVPFVSDIIDSVYHNVESEYIIYTNADIGVQPNFYVEVVKLLKNESGEYENGMSITRKQTGFVHELNGDLLSYLSMDEIYKQGMNGIKHKGHDCLIFKRSLWNRKDLDMTNVFLGYPTIGRTFAKQLLNKRGTKVIKDKYLTFHVGLTKDMTAWLIKLGLRENNQSERNDESHHEHSQLNRAFCDRILKRKRLK